MSNSVVARNQERGRALEPTVAPAIGIRTGGSPEPSDSGVLAGTPLQGAGAGHVFLSSPNSGCKRICRSVSQRPGKFGQTQFM